MKTLKKLTVAVAECVGLAVCVGGVLGAATGLLPVALVGGSLALLASLPFGLAGMDD
jgi:hypothetical protein